MRAELPKSLIRKIENRSARIGVIGLGYVGLPLAVEFARRGYRTVGIDLDGKRVANLGRGRSYIEDVSSATLKPLVGSGKLSATTRYPALKDLDAVMICVPTPLRKTKEPDISYIVAASEALARHLHRHQIIVLESTTYPGTTRELILPMLEATGLKAGVDFFLGFSPERIDPGNADYRTDNIPKVVSGITPACRRAIQLLYNQVIRNVITVSSTDVAEMVKLLENTFRSVNIGLVNELALMCHRLKLDVWEVIEAAKTKPFGFMPFYPGPGLGGHCLAGREMVTVRRGRMTNAVALEELFDRESGNPSSRLVRYRGSQFLRPKDLQILAWDPVQGRTVFRPVRWISSSRYAGKMVHLWTRDGRHLTVTDRHPMLVRNGTLEMRWAKDLKPADQLPVAGELPFHSTGSPRMDLVRHFEDLPAAWLRGIRVQAIGFSWKDHREKLRPILKRYRRDPWEYYRRNQIPLLAFLEVRRLPGFPPIDPANLRFCTGRGPSHSAFPAAIRLNPDFCRLIGYYLSEGCLTRDSSLRVRFCFHAEERTLTQDVRQILQRLGVRVSEHRLKRWKTVQVKVSSRPFGLLIRNVLKCGTDSYSMRVPPQILGLSRAHREALLSGLLRGDGGVDFVSGLHSYRKRGRRYTHRFHTASMNYFSSSRELFQQVILLLQGCGIVPTFKRRRKTLLTVFGEGQLRRCAEWLAGEKRARILRYLEGRRKRMPNKSFQIQDGLVSVPVRQLQTVNGTRQVYSAEVEGAHTFVTSYGLVVHNCIPIDPLYLSWKARLHGFEPRFIDLSSQVNASMPEYVVERITEALNRRGHPLKGSRILILGVAYKPNVTDTRESPALEILQQLIARGARVAYHDPMVARFSVNGRVLRSVGLSKSVLSRSHCTVIVTDHAGVDYRSVLRHARLILDTRNALRGFQVNSHRVVRL